MFILGLVGHWKKASMISLIAGVGFGILLMICSLLMFWHKNVGMYAATIFTFLLTAVFGVRYTLTHNPLPAILAVLSGGMLLFLLAQLPKWKKE
jgi:uncharacterized membrane protein (UPF0136 family)